MITICEYSAIMLIYKTDCPVGFIPAAHYLPDMWYVCGILENHRYMFQVKSVAPWILTLVWGTKINVLCLTL